MMNVLVTGGAGFIGSALVRYLVEMDDVSVLNVDKLTYAGNLDSLKSIENHQRYEFCQIDINDKAKITEVINRFQPDLVMHLAAESHVDRSIDSPNEFMVTNVIGTCNLLQVVLEYWKNLPEKSQSRFRFHHISTDEVYGDLGEGSSELFTETSAYAPSSPYSASKAASDHIVRAWGRTYGLPIIISNCSNNYGPYHFPEKLIPHVILNALKGAPLPIYGDGQQIRDWLYVEDHVKALYLVATQGKVGDTYNIGGHCEVSNLNVVNKICDILNEIVSHKPEGVDDFSNLIHFVEDRPGHDRRYAIDASKMEKELKWRPEESFESGLRKTVVWYLENESWCTRVLNGSYQLTRQGRGTEQ